MNAQIRSLITDIKAAARIGHIESLEVAMDGLADLPQVAGNPPMDAAFIEKAILPIGEALANPRLNLPVYQMLLADPQAAFRACGAAALAFRFFVQDDPLENQLGSAGKDPRPDVRQALEVALSQAGEAHTDKLRTLVETWINDPSPRLQAIAVGLTPRLESRGLALISKLDNPSDPEVRSALVKALSSMSQAGQTDAVLDLLGRWARDGENNVWVVCKTLSGSWAAGYPQAALEILADLLPKADPPKQIINSLQALYRHGAEQAVIAGLNGWRKTGSPAQKQVAEHTLNKLS